MDGCMNGLTDVWMYGWMNGWMEEWMNGWIYGCMDGWVGAMGLIGCAISLPSTRNTSRQTERE